MIAQETPNGILLKELPDFSLPDTLDCGQCFTFYPAERSSPEETQAYEGTAFGRYLRISRNTQGDITLHHVSWEEYEAVWRGYFDLDTDYHKIKEALSQDETLRKATAYAPGIRVLRQDGWEALCSFIISQNNNVKRIQGILSLLCREFGRPLQQGFYSFPTISELKGVAVEDLAPLRSGFRAKYLVDAVQKIAGGEVCLEGLSALPIDEARAELMKIHGVGPKVADCALLYGFHRIECCPMDVWMKRVLSELYPGGFPDCALPYLGIAQQYLFHYARTGDILPQPGKPAKPSGKKKALPVG